MRNRSLPVSLLLFGCIVDLALAVPAPAAPLRLMSFNVWHAGSQVSGGAQKIVDAIVAADVDVVGFQESEGHAAADVASALGWFALQGPGSVALASRYPIAEVFALAKDEAALGARVRIADAPARDVIVWVAHLGYTSYGPYAACDGGTAAALRRGEARSGRMRQIRDIVSRLRGPLAEAGAVPVFLLGDFNAPSHRDWTAAAASLHCGATFAWPVSSRVEKAGFVDLFRAVHPDPVTVPGTTWSPIFLAPGEPQDRIDLIYGRGAVAQSAEVFVVGTPEPSPGHADNGWPSDHAAVVAAVEVNPTAGVDGRAPTLALDRAVYGPDEPIVATVQQGPGNGSDWVGLYRAGDDPFTDDVVAWQYLHGTTSPRKRGRPDAVLTFSAGTLPPGDYVAHLLYGDGYGVLTSGFAFSVTASP